MQGIWLINYSSSASSGSKPTMLWYTSWTSSSSSSKSNKRCNCSFSFSVFSSIGFSGTQETVSSKKSLPSGVTAFKASLILPY